MRTAARDHHRRGAGHVAAGLVPASDRRPARKHWRAGGRALQAAPNISPTSSAASARSRCGWPAKSRVARLRQRCRRGHFAAESRDLDVRAEAGQGRSARPVPPAADAAGIARLRRCCLRSAAAGRAGANAHLRQQIPARRVSCNVTTFARDAGLLVDGGYRIEASRRSINSVTRRMSNWWRGSCADTEGSCHPTRS